MIAAHLSSDAQEWVRVAEMCLEHQDIKQAISCYSKGNWLKLYDIPMGKTFAIKILKFSNILNQAGQHL